MPAPAAAHYLGVSVSKLRTLPIPRKMIDRKRVYDRIDLDAYASSLPTEGEGEDVSCSAADEVWGVSA